MIRATLLLAALAAGVPEEGNVILAVSPFYPGHAIGAKNKPDGLFESRDGGKTWQRLTWPELIAGSVSVDASGQWIYLAAGNGVLVSSDSGENWKLTGGWKVSEVQRVFIDPADPRRAWAATSYGLFRTDDSLAVGEVWKRVETPFRYCSDVIVAGDVTLVGAETGIFRADGRRGFQHTGPEFPIRKFRKEGSRLFAATDGGGLLESGDLGVAWKACEGAPLVCYTVDIEPDTGSLYCGSIDGVHVRRNGAWSHHRVGESDSPLIYAICFPGPAGRVLASGKAGIFESVDAGSTWRVIGLEGAIVTDLWSGRKALPAGSDGTTMVSLAPHPTPTIPPAPAPAPDYAARRSELRRTFAASMKERTDVFGAIVRVRENMTDDALWAAVKKLCDEPGTTMFYSLPMMALYLQGGSALPADLRKRIRDALTSTPFYRGDTENHWVMHYAAQILMVQSWPEIATWPTGQSAGEARDDARGWLIHWMQLTATRGQGEFDSPGYLFMYMTPMLLLQEYSYDEEIRRLAGMMLDLLFADYFTESLGGAWCGGHSRITSAEVRRGADNVVSAYHFLYAGGIDRPQELHPWVVPACYAAYRPPALLSTIANRRDVPFVHTEVKRTRNILRYHDELHAPVYKYDYITPDFGLGSLQGGILQPIQQHTWDVTWRSAAPNPTLFSVHPWASGRELAMFFAGDPHYLVEVVRSGKGDYTSPDKWVSSSPYERIIQREDTLLALYDVPPDEIHPHVNLYWPACLKKSIDGGWAFGRDGHFCVAVNTLRFEGQWEDIEGGSRYRCPGQKSGFIVIAGPRGTETFDQFRSRVMAVHVPTYDEAAASAPDFPSRRLFNGPFMSSDVDSGVITLTDGMTDRILDFNRGLAFDRPHGAGGDLALLFAGIAGGALLALAASRRR